VNHDALYQALKFPDDERSTNQVAQFTNQSLIRVWQGEARSILTGLGYDDSKIALSDAGTLARLLDHSQMMAEGIAPTVNDMLGRQIDKLASDLYARSGKRAAPAIL